MQEDSSAKRNVAKLLADKLRASIVKGSFQPGDALPSERELAAKYDVNRSSVREAMKQLEAWGLVKIRHGGATRVADLLDAGLNVVPSLIEAGGPIGEQVLRDLLEVRELVLGWTAEQAARKADDDAIAKLDELARALSDKRATRESLQRLDYDWFQELLRTSGNQLLALFGRVVRDVYFRDASRFLSLYADGVFSAEHHRACIDAIRKRDAQAAGDAMRAHAASARRITTARGEEP